MTSFVTDSRKALDKFESNLKRLHQVVEKEPDTGAKLTKNRRSKLIEQCEKAAAAVGKLRQSVFIVEQTGVDIVDIQSRISGEAVSLASTLRDLGGVIPAEDGPRSTLEKRLIDLEESAQDVAGALFPSAVDNLREVNVKLWEFSRVEWVRYQHKLGDIVRQEKLSSQQQTEIERGFELLRDCFDDANEFLNELARNDLTGKARIRSRLRKAKKALELAESQAETERKQSIFKPFKGLLGNTKSAAQGAGKGLAKLQIPVFPAHADLDELRHAIREDEYAKLPGIGVFAMLNIASRLRSVTSNGEDLLSAKFKIRIERIFPDRIYFEADDTLFSAIKALKQQRIFKDAPASLHRYNFGSVKQQGSGNGSLQLSYTKPRLGRMKVDADIDLYRNPVLHLFGEVFVNHLTGSKTSQFKVRTILDRQKIRPIGNFGIVSG